MTRPPDGSGSPPDSNGSPRLHVGLLGEGIAYNGTSACRGRFVLKTSTRDALRLMPEGRRLDSTGSFSARRPYGEHAKENGEEKESGSELHSAVSGKRRWYSARRSSLRMRAPDLSLTAANLFSILLSSSLMMKANWLGFFSVTGIVSIVW